MPKYLLFGVLTLRDEINLVGQIDEDQDKDNEICTVTSARVDSGERKSAPRSRFDKNEGL